MPLTSNRSSVMKSSVLTIVLAMILTLAAQPAVASFHLWDINEVYSNADGSVQYIELFSAFNNQEFTTGRPINAVDIATIINTFTFPSNTPSPTAGHHLLIATPGFAALPGAVTPDFILPTTAFFNVNSPVTTIDFVAADVFSFGPTDIPTDGVNSLNNDLSTGINSPTNYAGQVGLLGPPSLPGDLDDDGFVGINDLNIILAVWNQNVPPADPRADPSGDGFVGIDDLGSVLGNWNAGSPPANSAAPEPATLTLLMLAGTTLTRRRH